MSNEKPDPIVRIGAGLLPAALPGAPWYTQHRVRKVHIEYIDDCKFEPGLPYRAHVVDYDRALTMELHAGSRSEMAGLIGQFLANAE